MAKGKINEVRKKLAKMHEMISTSYHECSHVLYGILYFIEITKVELIEESNGRISGFTHFNSFEPKDFDNLALLKQIAINDIGLRYAGLAGEKIFLKKISGSDNFPFVLKDGSRRGYVRSC